MFSSNVARIDLTSVDPDLTTVSSKIDSNPVTTDFSALLTSMGTEAARSLTEGEKAAASGIQGSTSVQHVVESIMKAERELHAALAIRDKIVSAYQEISRTAI